MLWIHEVLGLGFYPKVLIYIPIIICNPSQNHFGPSGVRAPADKVAIVLGIIGPSGVRAPADEVAIVLGIISLSLSLSFFLSEVVAFLPERRQLGF